MYNEAFMTRAIELSAHSLDTPGTRPFGAVIVKDGKIVGEGLNHSEARLDPTSHGEVEAIRNACRKLDTLDLSGCELYTSCEPCSICVATMEVVGIDAMYYAADVSQSGEVLSTLAGTPYGNLDTGRIREQVGLKVGERDMPAEQHHSAAAVDVLQQWAAGILAARHKSG